ncbi:MULTISPECIES: metalloregulator ArsR/SmtB family transcription factor [Nitratireductor]|uniref:helix-turn-helix transcriptional regulator n=1 Tax=Nitratireductor TaxID=245876 RepID=UPI003008BF23
MGVIEGGQFEGHDGFLSLDGLHRHTASVIFQVMSLKTTSDNMSSEGLENTGWTPRNPAERVLMLLKMHGSLTAAALGDRLGTTGEAARQQLVRLADEGLAVASSEPAGVGRPTRIWKLTAAGHSRFPDTHAALTVQVLESVRSVLGEDALERIIEKREDETRAQYRAAMVGCTGLHERVAALTELRSGEGYMASWRETDDGNLLLVENHCPICAAATSCQGFCRAELNIFRDVLGPEATVERAEHLVNGGHRCSYVIREADA